MKPPTTKHWAAALLAVTLLSAGPAIAIRRLPSTLPTTTQAFQPPSPLSILAGYAGTWSLDGNWANGNSFKGRQVFETIAGGKFVTCRTWSASGDAAETERDFVVFGEQNGTLVQWVYTPDGQCRQTPATATGDASIQFDWTKTDAKGKATELRMILNDVDTGHYRWRTQMHIKGEWHTLIDGEWKRK